MLESRTSRQLQDVKVKQCPHESKRVHRPEWRKKEAKKGRGRKRHTGLPWKGISEYILTRLAAAAAGVNLNERDVKAGRARKVRTDFLRFHCRDKADGRARARTALCACWLPNRPDPYNIVSAIVASSARDSDQLPLFGLANHWPGSCEKACGACLHLAQLRFLYLAFDVFSMVYSLSCLENEACMRG